MSFAHLHLHTEYSLLDGLTRIPDLVKKVQASGMTSVAVTDHGNMFGIMKLVDACQKTADADGNLAVKPILGCEVYVAPRSRLDRKLDNAAMNAEGMEDCLDPSGSRDAGYHLVLLAKNPVGFRNLSKLVSRGFTEGFYYKPRVDKELLRENSEGIIALTACLGGEVQARLLSGNIDAAERIARDYQSMFGDDFYLEIQDQGFEAERQIIPLQYELSRRTGIPLVATNDSHYLNHEDADLHDTLLCIGTKTFKSAAKRMRFSTDQFFAKTPEEMAAAFKDHPEVLERTLEIAAKIDLYPITRKPVTPQFPVPSGHTLESYFLEVARAAFEDRLKECQPLWQRGVLKYTEDKYRARLAFELDTILSMGFPGYFLLVWDFIRKSREMGVPVGPGRGSAAGSIVAWSMHITDIDPMQYDLLFERFLNPERISMPDVDIDFCRDGRQKVIDYVTETYGKDRVSNIVTINQLKTKAVIKDVSRVFEKDFAFANNLTKLVPQEPGKPITIAQALEQSDKLRELYESDPEVKNILDLSARLEGLARNTGIHAAGVIIAPDDLTKFAPLSRDKDGKVMVQYSMTDAERAGLLKMDFLGLETLTQIAKTQEYIAKTHGQPLDMLTIRTFDDKKTFDLFSQGDTDGVFQFESGGMKQLLRNLKPDRFDDLIALNALFRPGPLGAGMGDTYVNRRHGREPITYMFPTLEPILAPTYGVILYQEQVMQIASLIAGYSLGEADMLRRAMGKKDFAKMAKEKSKFIDQGVSRGYDRATVSELFDLIEYFAGYGFNKCVHGSTRVVHAETGEVRTVEELYRERLPWMIHALGQDGTLNARKVVDVMANGRKPVFLLTTTQGKRITATGNHPFLTIKGWTLLEDLQPGDRIAAPRHLDVRTRKTWPAHEVIVLAGLLSEGNTCHPTCLYFFNNDPLLIEDFAEAAEKFTHSKARIYERPDHRFEVCVNTGHDTKFKPGQQSNGHGRSGMYHWASGLGTLGLKAASKRIPEEVFTLCDNDLALFLGRLWSGDGSLGDAKLKVPYYATSSHELAWGVQLILLRLGIQSGIHKKLFKYREGTRVGYCVHIFGEHALEHFLARIGTQLLGRAEQMEVLRSHVEATERGLTSVETVPAAVRVHAAEARVAKGLTWKELESRSGLSMKEFYGKGGAQKRGFRRGTLARLADVLDSQVLSTHARSDVFWDQVASILPAGEEETYDLTVQDDHNFVADGLIVHNSHSAAYALIAYETGYLKANYLTEFMAGLLSTKSNRTDDVVKYIQNCRELGLEVLGPDINQSELDFTITGPNQIRFGFAAIKGLGEAALEAILAARAEEGGFKDFFHALKATDLQKANRRVWESLIKAGAFDSMEVNRAALVAGLPSALENAGKGGVDTGMTSLFDEAEIASLADNWALPEDVEPWSRKERLRNERETLGLYVSGHPLEEFKDALQVHTAGSIAALKEGVAAGRIKDRDEVSLGVMVSNVAFKTNAKGEPWAILYLEDLTDKVEALLMAAHFDPATRKRTRTFELYRHLALPDALLRVKGELKVETAGGNSNGAAAEGEAEEEEQTVIKLFVIGLESLEDFQGKGFSGAVVKLPKGQYPDRLLPLLRLYKGSLPLQIEFQGQDGTVARVKAGSELSLRFDPDLSDRVVKEAGCGLSWTY
jgi:DNA polymerase-3 subunit alpha